MNARTSLVIAALAVAVVVLGYLYYDSTRNDITIELPKVNFK